MSKQKQATLLEAGEAWLTDFADLHHVSRNEAQALWSRGMIRGRKIGQGRTVRIALDAAGRYEAYYQFKILNNFAACDKCPHQAGG